jgi:hypothetical protein
MDKPYLTSDLPFAAYLCHEGYTLLGAVRYPDSERMDLALVWPHDDLKDMKADILQHLENYNSGTRGYKTYFQKLRMCKRALNNPVSIEAVTR